MRAAALVLCASIVGLALPANVAAYCRLTTQMPEAGQDCATEGAELFWPTQCLGYSVVPRDEPDPPLDALRDEVDISFQTWTEVTCSGTPVGLDLRQTADTATCIDPEYNPDGPNANTVMFLDDWGERDLPAVAFGLTLVWHHPETGEIYDADVQINETLGTLAICGDVCARRDVDIRNVVAHEAGHYLGLGHTSDTIATMSARATLGETSKRTLEDDDREGLCAIYGALPAPACEALDFDPANGFGPDCYFGESVTTCGCAAPGAASSATGVAGSSAGGAGSGSGRRLGWLGLLVLLISVRARRRVLASSSTPSPMKR